MADRCHDRSFLTDADYDRSSNPYVRRESDWLAERIGQTDSFGTPAKTPLTLPSGGNVLPQYAPAEEEASASAGWSPRMQRARQEAPPQQEYEQPEPQYQPSPLRPSRCRPVGLPAAASEQDHHDQDANEQPVNDALYCSIKTVEHTRDPAYPMVTVAAVLALAVVGTGAALTYRTYVGSERSGETPIVRADISQTKVMPVQSDGGVSKIPDRMPPSDGGEKLVSREEAPVDSNSNSGLSRAVFPPLNQSSSPPPVASVSSTALATTANGTMPNNEPRKIKTVKSDAENGGIPAGAAAPAKPDPAARSASTPTAPAQRKPSAANASANAPLTLSPQSAPASDPAPPIRLAATNTVQAASSAGGGYLVQVSSQKNEADVQASYRALQSKFPAALGSRPPVIKRADLGDKGVYYRTMVGPFGSSEEATQFCGNLKSSGGQCVIQKMAKTTE